MGGWWITGFVFVILDSEKVVDEFLSNDNMELWLVDIDGNQLSFFVFVVQEVEPYVNISVFAPKGDVLNIFLADSLSPCKARLIYTIFVTMLFKITHLYQFICHSYLGQ